MNTQEVLALLEGIFVGYNPANTVDTALFEATKRFNTYLKTNFSFSEVKELMKNESLISSRGLDNYLLKACEKMLIVKNQQNKDKKEKQILSY